MPQYAYTRVTAVLRQQVESGQIPPGAALPSERALAEEHDVSVGTVRRAVKQLVDEGLLAVLPGSGTYVLEYGPSDEDAPPEGQG